MRKPSECPKCKAVAYHPVMQQKKGFSVGKAVTGSVLLGPVGLLGGALGKKKTMYQCQNCGYMQEY